MDLAARRDRDPIGDQFRLDMARIHWCGPGRREAAQQRRKDAANGGEDF